MFRIALTAVAATIVLGSSTTWAAASPEQECQEGRYKAAAKYAGCHEKAAAKYYGDGDFGKFLVPLSKCVSKYTAVWAKLQKKATGTGSSCDAERLVDNDATVIDNLTGLEWEKKTTDATVHNAGDTYSWSSSGEAPDGTAFSTFLAGLYADGCFDGLCDWRLPTIAEAVTILLEPYVCHTDPCIDPIFGAANSGGFWSSTTDASNPAHAYNVSLHDGQVFGGNKGGASEVRAVRSRW